MPPSSLAVLRRLLAHSSRPLYALDEERRLVFVNDALVAWCGVPAEELLERRCDYHGAGEAPAERVASGLCPPPEALSGASPRCELLISLESGLVRRGATVLTWSEESDGPRLALIALDADEQRLDAAPTPTTPAAAHLEDWRLRLARFRSRLSRYATYELLGDSPVMGRVREQFEAATACRVATLVVGPAGSGREHVARSIHYSRSTDGAMGLVPLACPLLDVELLNGTLEDLRRSAVDELRGGATLLLLDVDELSGEAQSALAAAVREESETLLLSTARRPLLRLAAEGTFVPELAQRLSPLTIELPALADRPEDIPLLAEMVLEEHNATGARQLSGFATDALDQLLLYPWGENVAEFRLLVGQACAEAMPPRVRAGDLPPRIREASLAAAHPPRKDEPLVLDEFLEQVERELLQRALRRAKGNKSRAAKLLGINRQRLLRRLEYFQGLDGQGGAAES